MNTFLNEPLVGQNPRVGVLESKILRTLLYFDIFHHPLRAWEIRQYLQGAEVSEEQFEKAMKTLLHKRMVFCMHDFYAVRKPDGIADRRIYGERRAAKAMRKAKKYSALISAFPFVMGVCISGSLSKGTMDEKADIDYFVITHPGRLWLSRTLLTLFKKIFLLNSRKYFCINYFISADNLHIPDQNIFTATESVSLIPTYNHNLYEKFLNSNEWVRNYYPHYRMKTAEECIPEKQAYAKRMTEKIFSGKMGENLDAFCFRITLRYWKRKFSNFDVTTFDHRLRSRKDVSKHHPQGFQEKVLKAYESQIQKFEDQHSLSLASDV